MSKAITEHLNEFSEEVKGYTDHILNLKTVPIASCLLKKEEKATLADYINEADFDASRVNLEARKEVLEVKMDKLKENGKTLEAAVEGLVGDIENDKNDKK